MNKNGDFTLKFLISCEDATVATFVHIKSMFSKSLVHKNRPYFENSGPNYSKLGSFVDKHHIFNLHNVCGVQRGMFSTPEGYHEYTGGVQCTRGIS